MDLTIKAINYLDEDMLCFPFNKEYATESLEKFLVDFISSEKYTADILFIHQINLVIHSIHTTYLKLI